MSNSKKSRRDFIIQMLTASGGVAMKSLLLGVPPAFLSKRIMAAPGSDAKFLIFSSAGTGDPVNVNVPGTYGAGKESFKHHDVAGFSTPTNFTLGGKTYSAAAPWATLQASLRNHFQFIHHASLTNAHGEMSKVLEIQGALKQESGLGNEMIVSAIAYENAKRLGTVLDAPIRIGGTLITVKNSPQPLVAPASLKSLFTSSSSIDTDAIKNYRDKIMDELYSDLKTNGTQAQIKFLDKHAISTSQARQLGESLGSLLNDIRGNNGQRDQIIAATAMAAANVSPVSSIRLNFGGDNHADPGLSREVSMHNNTIEEINYMWSKLNELNMQDKVNFALLNVFGRTLNTNSSPGRDHNSGHAVMLLAGTNIKGGVTGDCIPDYDNKGNLTHNRGKATGINSVNGSSTSPDIAPHETLASAAKTLMKSVGVDDQTIEERIVLGKQIKSILL